MSSLSSAQREEIAEVTLACVRELLSKRGLTRTLEVLDEEAPRRDGAISKRSLLAKALGIEDLVARNKEKAKTERLGSMLEVMAAFFVERVNGGGTEPAPSAPTASLPSRSRSGRPSRSRASADENTSQGLVKDLSRDRAPASSFAKPSASPRKAATGWHSGAAGDDVGLMMEDFDDDGSRDTRSRPVGRGGVSLGKTRAIGSGGGVGRVVQGSEMAEIKALLFPGQPADWSTSWLIQGFQFSDVGGLEFGLIQNQGGPCGVVAAVQATLLLHLYSTKQPVSSVLEPTPPSADGMCSALVAAITDIIWRAGGGTRAVYARVQTIRRTLKHTDKATAFEFGKREDLREFIQQNLAEIQEGGCIPLVYSVLLSKGVETIKAEMDTPTNRLIAAHNYCNQELVNLLLLGYAASNVFNGVKDLSSGSDKMILRGVQDRGDVGLLTLFEHYGSMEVGTHLKTPLYPIWVVCSESHYSVLFGEPETPTDARKGTVPLYYYDPLGQQDMVIRITVDTTTPADIPDEETTLVSPLDHCIRTKWTAAGIDWHGHPGVF